MPLWSFLVVINLKTMYTQICFKPSWKTTAQRKGNNIRSIGVLRVNRFRIRSKDCLCKYAFQYLNTWKLLTVHRRPHDRKCNEWLILGDEIISLMSWITECHTASVPKLFMGNCTWIYYNGWFCVMIYLKWNLIYSISMH